MSATTETLHGTFRAVLLRWGERASQFHDTDPRRRYLRGEVHTPRQNVPLYEDHDGPEIGLVSSFEATDDGLECSIKLDPRGEELIRQGYRALSAEITEAGELIGVALAVHGEPAFRSARIVETVSFASGARGGRDVLDEEPFRLELGLDPRTGALAFRPRKAAIPSPAPTYSSGNLTDVRRDLDGVSMRPVHDEVRRARERFRQRQQELAEEDAGREESMLVAAGIPVPAWPTHLLRRQSYDAMVERKRAEGIAADIARRAEALELVPAPVPPRRWWQRWSR